MRKMLAAVLMGGLLSVFPVTAHAAVITQPQPQPGSCEYVGTVTATKTKWVPLSGGWSVTSFTPGPRFGYKTREVTREVYQCQTFTLSRVIAKTPWSPVYVPRPAIGPQSR